ncbi:hypothetical protein GW943_03005 [Candidatus Parcubacteria bacterium]|uniref:DUF5673 domain-containing protein n=1 Tax=Candidatus Kaiserbacteria bacterium CG10_big_fil_rev_8_21_14_0_10_47_16 TaxID=1974608 RepID=A0A2H0UDZ7_9BACT|nr:hypothetical protein [Candidatus Parcubacteria bacterium]PIR84644.1 MAG: hypothetical protein COU16_03675 [Candidatus Kaiserbacteria bacterium CG10_big_fil_rev_8_21_14_0_10_47_16]
MAEAVQAVTWEATQHHHIEKGQDWFWILGLIAVAGAVAAFIFGDVLFGVVILLGAIVMAVFALHEPEMKFFAITTRGLRIEDQLYPYATLESYYIDEDHPQGAQLLIKSERMFMPLLIIPIPDEYTEEIDEILRVRLLEEHLEEPLAHRLLEFFGF